MTNSFGATIRDDEAYFRDKNPQNQEINSHIIVMLQTSLSCFTHHCHVERSETSREFDFGTNREFAHPKPPKDHGFWRRILYRIKPSVAKDFS
jgi:hypothetical protein